ncbi:hypothetical protein KKB43_03770 [Patescibacteria group bacterium]|nr:hypothetical protein [Patescibacteria group bacterium]MBU4580107.1 hypothetical protein [Patescibacteria group bacterium]
MNKKYILLSIVILTTFSLLILGEKVLATVGGQTYISEIAYNTTNSSVYYLVNDYSGKECPPVIHSINLANNQDTQIKTCDEVFQEFFKNYSEENNQKYRQFISDFYKNLFFIGSVSLKKNNINVSVSTLSERVENGEKYWTEFRAILTQDNKEVAKIDFRGCDKEQPHIFEGYKIPNSDAMAILISNKGDCFEGGYVRETLHLVRGIKYYDTNIVRSFKESSATEPNLGNMIVYASSRDATNNNNIDNSTNIPANQPEVTQPTQQNQPKNLVTVSMMLSGVVILVAGILLGYLIGKRSARPTDKNFPNLSQ